MVKIIKKSGVEEKFVPGKIRASVKKAAKEAGLAPNKIGDLIQEIAEPVIQLFSKKEVVKTTDLRKSLLGRLDKKAKKVSAAWRKHDKKVKKK
jgi:transcriptional repressor NrdR